MTQQELVAMLDAAHEAGNEAAKACVPRPMVVGGHTYEGGMCGFAWVSTRANNPFGRAIAKACRGTSERDFMGWRKSSMGGFQLWVHYYGQSAARKAAYANAYAEYIREQGGKAYAGSRLD